jgi:hypothetical protein
MLGFVLFVRLDQARLNVPEPQVAPVVVLRVDL